MWPHRRFFWRIDMEKEIRIGDDIIYKGSKYKVLNLKKVKDDEYAYFLGGIRQWARKFQIQRISK